ncbi:SLC13 family permease [Actinosynnema mirum]|uniref:Arsenical pump membrane protein n=1 Tax=Actinosynnema mirum (strain ATCC 29888 / DSM 43827 / JCM 3225 / NBRC 14064 / NCIMB 13271 / NRRL B-12336 / IMRU 3971 / 101) TaxID=446462 RepID=C6W841_ACTMD|nr:SLC13 family permease [Actinosynnema mirum]ACU37062.1 Arsenical pump membrane protein [Actinosynnema mirum DSM 43827]
MKPGDKVAAGVLLAGVACVATGWLPGDQAWASLARVAPLLLFLTGVVVIAELAREALVFDVAATGMAIAARGRPWALFALCVLFAATLTALLNLDTTAVLLTPVLLALAVRTGVPGLPLAMVAVWLANTASLLLPVSNLTNLLAADRIGLTATGFAARMWAPQLASVLVTAAVLWVLHWRKVEPYRVPEPVRPRDRRLFGVSLAACLLFAASIPFVHDGIAFVAAGIALALVAAFAALDRSVLRPSLVPWRLLVLVSGLFLLVPALVLHGVGDAVSALVGTGLARTAAVSAGLANALNNLPAYTAVEAALPGADADHLLAVLIGVNAGSVALPWASLATLICLEACARAGVRVPMARFVASGVLVAVLTVAAATGALWLTG